MNRDAQWVSFLARRTFAYAVLGGAFCAALGSILICASGASVGLLMDKRIWPVFQPTYEYTKIGASLGMVFGFISALILSGIIFAVIGFTSPPARRLLPPRPFLLKAAQGMTLGTTGAMTGFYALAFGWSLVQHKPFISVVSDWVFIILFAAPITMLIGLLAGVVFGVRHSHCAMHQLENFSSRPLHPTAVPDAPEPTRQ